MEKAQEHLAEMKELLATVEADMEELATDVEGHLRVCVAYLRAAVSGRKETADKEPSNQTGGTTEVADEPAGPQPPPKAGPGSGATAWEDYAAANGVEVPEGSKRDDIISLLEEAGVPTAAEG